MDIASVPVPVEIGHAEGAHCAIVSDDDGTSGGELAGGLAACPVSGVRDSCR
jgi:hypothetical protein